MQRYQETAQQESFPLAEAHVISPANPPLTPSYPAHAPRACYLPGARNTGRRRCRHTPRVYRLRFPDSRAGSRGTRRRRAWTAAGCLATSLQEHVPDNVARVMRYAIDNPFSAFAETLRSAKMAVNHALKDRSPKIIGLVSLLPKEGKSTVAKNFARLLALQGARTLLIDADTRNPALTRAMGCEWRQASQSEIFCAAALGRAPHGRAGKQSPHAALHLRQG